jgi:thiol-disulfide isomerase/thioredoxin
METPTRATVSRFPARRDALLIVCAALLAFWAALLAPRLAHAAPAAAAASQPAFWYGTAADGSPSVRLYFFWTPTCPHCRAAQPFVADLRARLPWLEIVSLPVKDNPTNAKLYYETAQSLGVEAMSVPGFLFCRKVEIGYDTAATTGAYLVKQLEQCRERILADPAAMHATAQPVTGGGDEAGTTSTLAADSEASLAGPDVVLPFLGAVGATTWSLPVLTVALAGVDAFNPCAFFVLLFLLSILVHARRRSRMLIVGGTFVLISGLAYFAFMAAWLNMFMIAGEMRLVTIGAGVLALVIGALNVKDYFWFREGPSLSIPESAKPGLFRRMRTIATAGSLGPMLASTVLLAVVANSYELLCTAGFPMVYTRALTLANLETWQYYAYLAAYNAIYVLPLFAIVVVFTKTMGSRKLTETEGRWLKLMSGYMMAAFGAVLLFAPTLLTNALSSVLVLGAALAAALLTGWLAKIGRGTGSGAARPAN